MKTSKNPEDLGRSGAIFADRNTKDPTIAYPEDRRGATVAAAEKAFRDRGLEPAAEDWIMRDKPGQVTDAPPMVEHDPDMNAYLASEGPYLATLELERAANAALFGAGATDVDIVAVLSALKADDPAAYSKALGSIVRFGVSGAPGPSGASETGASQASREMAIDEAVNQYDAGVSDPGMAPRAGDVESEQVARAKPSEFKGVGVQVPE